MNRTVELAALGKDLLTLRLRNQSQDAPGQMQVVERLLRLHGLPQKIGQILSLSELNDDTPVFTRLVETPAQLSPEQASSEIEKALGRSWRTHFRFIDPNGIAASFAQVHRGVLHDGREVAVKIQYPGIRESLELDLKALGWLTVPFGGMRKGFDLAGYRREVGEMLRQELDFRHELEMLKRYGSFTSSFENVAVPDAVEELSNDRIITMTWIEGSSFADVRRWKIHERRQLGQTLLALFFASVFSARMIHADPHPGNYRFQLHGNLVRLGLLDFGCVKTLTSETTKALHALIADTISGDLRDQGARAQGRFEALGFNSLLLTPMRHLLPGLCEILFEPLLKNEPFDMRQWHLGPRVEDALGPLRWNFRTAGPPDLIYFMRAYQGLIQYLEALEAPVNWRAAYESVGISETVEPCTFRATETRDCVASSTLRIRVTRAGRTKADLTFPVAAAESLNDLIPPEVEPKLAARNIDLGRISESLIATGFPPGELFSIREGDDNFRVWLE